MLRWRGAWKEAAESRRAASGAGPSSEGAASGAAGAAASERADGGAGARPRQQKRVSFSSVLTSEAQRVDESYFDSYSYFDIHREMLGDKARPPPLPPGLGV